MITTAFAAVTALGALMLGGLFLAFAVAVMPGLACRPPDEAAAAMRAINRAVVGPVFLLLFVGTAVAAAVTVVLGILDGRPLLTVGAGLTLVGAHVITVGVNIPLNTALDTGLDSGPDPGPDTGRPGAWDRFAGPWNRAHLVRTLFTIVGGTLTAAGLLVAA